jgi:transcriptional regulator with XRE-family HTH domain
MDGLEELREKVAASRTLPSPAVRRALRESAGVPLRAIAELLKVTPEAVRLWERGLRRPSHEHLHGYLEALRVLRDGDES